MPFDIIAFYESQAAAALTAFAGVADDVYRVSGDDIYVQPRAPHLAALVWAGVTQATLKYAEVRQPSLKVPYRFYQGGHLTGTGANMLQKALHYFFAHPLPLYPGEKLNAYIQNSSTEINMLFAWLTSGPATYSSIENVKPTHLITGYADKSLTAGSWTALDIETNGAWDQDLPEGRYAVVGMRVATYKATGVAGGVARLKLLDTTWRPGVTIDNMTADKLGIQDYVAGFDVKAGYSWPLMPEISFNHDQMPDIEICAGAANTDHVANLLLQKIK